MISFSHLSVRLLVFTLQAGTELNQRVNNAESATSQDSMGRGIPRPCVCEPNTCPRLATRGPIACLFDTCVQNIITGDLFELQLHRCVFTIWPEMCTLSFPIGVNHRIEIRQTILPKLELEW
jgi:hypothetical protein